MGGRNICFNVYDLLFECNGRAYFHIPTCKLDRTLNALRDIIHNSI